MVEDRAEASGPAALAEAAQSRVASWHDRVRERAAEPGAETHRADPLSGARADGFEFTRRLLDFVALSEDPLFAALGLREASQRLPDSMPLRDRLAVKAGGVASLAMPWAVMPVARRWLRERLSHLVLPCHLPGAESRPGRAAALTEALRRLGEAGLSGDVMPLGETVQGPEGASAEAARLAALAAAPGVSRVVVDPARLMPGGSDWAFEDLAAGAARALRPVFEAAAEHGTTVLIEPRSARWARLAPDVLVRGLADPALGRVRVGLGVAAELPESRDLLARVARWAQQRVAEGGQPAEVVLGEVGFAPVERIASIRSGLAVPVLEGAAEVSAQLLRLAEFALHPEVATVLRPVVASEDAQLLAAALELAARRGTGTMLAVRLRAGTAPALTELLGSLRAAGDPLWPVETRVLVPVAEPDESGAAAEYVIALAAEAADPESALARLDGLRRPSHSAEGISGSRGATGDGLSAVSGRDPDIHSTQDLGGRDGSDSSDAGRLGEILTLALERPFPPSHRTQMRAREWEPSERDSALFYRPPDEPAEFDTGGLTAAVLGLGRGSTGELTLTEMASRRTIPPVSATGFANEPETDATVAANRDWARRLLRRAAEDRRAAAERSADATVALTDADLDADAAVRAARTSGVRWAATPPRERAVRLRRLALATAAARDRLLQRLAADTGAPIAELDAQAGDVVDACRYLAQLAEGLSGVRGATFEPDALALVAADERSPLAAQAEAVLAGLAAGSGVLWAVPIRVAATAAALVEEWELAALPPGTVRVVPVHAFTLPAAEEAAGTPAAGAAAAAAPETLDTLGRLAAHELVDRATVLGDRDLSLRIARRRPALRIEGRFTEPGSIVVSSSCDVDAAVTDLVASAFAGAGADPRAAHAAILLGGIARSQRFTRGLADAVRALRVGDTAAPDAAADPLGFDVGPLPAPPPAAGLRALTELERGERWLVEPRRLDDAGLLWRPGVRLGVSPDSSFWRDAVGVPVLGLTHAHSLGEAIELQRRIGGGAVAGLFSLDAAEILPWLDRAPAASLVVGRPTTGARTERLPSGGWGTASTGIAPLAGGPHRLVTLGSWRARGGTRSETLHLRGLDPDVQLLIEAAQPALAYEDFDELRRACLADALAWRTTFGVAQDVSGLEVERNVLRHWPVPVHLRLSEGAPVAHLLRVVAAAIVVDAPFAVSTGEVLPPEVAAFLARRGVEVSLERDGDWLERLAATGAETGDGSPAERVRLIGGDAVRAAEWMGGQTRVALWAEPVTMAGPVELVALLREQSVSIRAHRHGLAFLPEGVAERLRELSR